MSQGEAQTLEQPPKTDVDHPRSRLRRLPLGLLGMIPLLLACESLVVSRWLDVTSPATLSWRLSDHSARSHASRHEILCLGDSLIKHGLLPNEIEAATHRPVFNLAVSAAQPPTTYFLLRHAIDSGAKPSAVLLGYSPDLLMGSPKESIRNYPEILSPLELISLASEAKDVKFATNALVGKLFPSIRARFEIREWVHHSVVGHADPSPRPTSLMLDRNWKLHQGAQFTPENPAFRGQLSQADIERLRADKFWCNRINQKYIDKTLKLAQWQQIRVFWVLPPVLPALQSVRDRSGADARHTEFVSTFLKKYPNLTAIDARTAGFLSTHFIDPIHLTGQGALALSRQVGKIVSAPSAVHWVKLSPELDTRGAEAYENLHQSEVAIRAELSRVRR